MNKNKMTTKKIKKNNALEINRKDCTKKCEKVLVPFSTNDIIEIVRICGDYGLTEFRFGELQIKFSPNLDSKDKTKEPIESQPAPLDTISPAFTQSDEDEQSNIELTGILDPSAYWDSIERGELVAAGDQDRNGHDK